MRRSDEQLLISASDMSNFLACRHLTRLDHAAAESLIESPRLKDVGFDALVERGEAHEAVVLQGFRDEGWSIVEIERSFEDVGRSVLSTMSALDDEVDVVYQGALQADSEFGYPDFLVRADLLGCEEGYEVVDAKLARTAKARAVLQSTFYSRLLAEMTSIEPRRVHLALGQGDLVSFNLVDFAAYERQINRMFEEFTFDPAAYPPTDTYPEPVEHCAICRWRVHCMATRRRDDDLSLIAGITASQRRALKTNEISTRRGFAGLEVPPALPGTSRVGLARAHSQARIQVEGEDAGEPRWELIDPEMLEESLVPDRGLLVLPEPAEGDLFFDIEGSRFYSEDSQEFGLQYLFGIVDTSEFDNPEQPTYAAYWAFDRAGERRAFEALMDFLSEHLSRFPDAHIYHYNHYEPTSMEHLSELHTSREDVLRRLMGRFATREDDLDNLLRRRLFIDLYRVVRQGVRASVESYSIKRLEPFFSYVRKVPLETVNEEMVLFEAALDEGTAENDSATQQLIAGYNEDDCRATLALRDWLEELRAELATQLGRNLPRPEPVEPEPDQTPFDIQQLRAALLEGLADEYDSLDMEDQTRVLMADLLEYHRREEKPGWWRYFHLLGLTDEELLEERDAIAGLEFVGDIGPHKRSRLFKYSFPPQEFSFSAGDSAVDPATDAKWALIDANPELGHVVIKRGPTKLDEPHPVSLIAPPPEFRTTNHRERVRSLAERVLALNNTEWPGDPQIDLLLRRQPNVGQGVGEPLANDGEPGLDAGRRLATSLSNSYLPIQGAPGTGKTYTGAHQIVDLVEAGKTVGVTAVSHAVVTNLLDAVADVAQGRGVHVRIGQRPDSDGRWVSREAADADLVFPDNQSAFAALASGTVDVVGGTTWVWTHPGAEGVLDVLAVDEAGQMSMADVLAASNSARSLIMLGDPLQLAHPGQGSHPPAVPGSALEYVLDGSATMPANLGLFLDETRRMHPQITAFTSEVFYDGRLSGIDELGRQRLIGDGRFAGSGLRLVEVAHEANSNASAEEAAEVAAIVRELLTYSWRDVNDEERLVTPLDILVVTPFNAQIRQIRQAFDAAGVSGVQVGTVDKFQGREAPVVVYSMAASSGDDAPRGLEFLFDTRRLNVATSRARAMAIVVGSPSLFRVFGRTPRQMQLVNALCRLRELATQT